MHRASTAHAPRRARQMPRARSASIPTTSPPERFEASERVSNDHVDGLIPTTSSSAFHLSDDEPDDSFVDDRSYGGSEDESWSGSAEARGGASGERGGTYARGAHGATLACAAVAECDAVRVLDSRRDREAPCGSARA